MILCGDAAARKIVRPKRHCRRDQVELLPELIRSSPAMDILKWPALAERRREHVFQLVKKYIEGRCPQYFNGYFTFNKIHRRATRQHDLLYLLVVRAKVAKRSFYYHGCIVFNIFSRQLF